MYKRQACTGYAGTGCQGGLSKYVSDYLKNAPDKYKKYCPTIAAAVGHESKYATHARSWDTCANTDGGKHGAVGLHQFDIISNIDPLPISPEEQLNALFNPSNPGQPNINNFGEKWMSCNPAGAAGGTGVTASEFKAALAECKKQGSGMQFDEHGGLPGGKKCGNGF